MQPTMIEAGVSVVPAIVALHALTRATIDPQNPPVAARRTRRELAPVARDSHAIITMPPLDVAAHRGVRPWCGLAVRGCRAVVHRGPDSRGRLGRADR